MTLNKFKDGAFEQTQTCKAFGAEIAARVENGREALAIAPGRRAPAPQQAHTAAA